MNVNTIFAVLSGVIAVVGKIPYVLDIFKLKTTPHSYSWLIWTLLQGTATFVMLDSGAGAGVVSLAISTVLCAFIFTLSLSSGTKNITTFDTVCFIGALLATGIWFFLHDALLSILLVSAMDALAFLPTFRKSYVEPYSETAVTYLFAGVGEGFSLLALANITVITSFYLISLVITNFSCFVLIWVRRVKINHS